MNRRLHNPLNGFNENVCCRNTTYDQVFVRFEATVLAARPIQHRRRPRRHNEHRKEPGQGDEPSQRVDVAHPRWPLLQHDEVEPFARQPREADEHNVMLHGWIEAAEKDKTPLVLKVHDAILVIMRLHLRQVVD